MEDVSELIVPEAILPAQYYGALTRSRTETRGEWRLLYAVLDDALRCFLRAAHSRHPPERRLFAETAAWIMDEADNHAGHRRTPEAGFSFVDICTALGIDAGCLRARLWQWYRTQRRRAEDCADTLSDRTMHPCAAPRGTQRVQLLGQQGREGQGKNTAFG
jgi:hypothetical protein